MFKKLLDFGMAGDNIGCLLRGTKREEVKRGQVRQFKRSQQPPRGGGVPGPVRSPIANNHGNATSSASRSQVLAAPGTMVTGSKFEAEVYCLTQDEGGRHTPFFSNYRPQFFFRTADITGALHLREGTEMIMPGDNATLDIELIAPIAIEEGLRFNMREGGRTVGTGVISKVTA